MDIDSFAFGPISAYQLMELIFSNRPVVPVEKSQRPIFIGEVHVNENVMPVNSPEPPGNIIFGTIEVSMTVYRFSRRGVLWRAEGQVVKEGDLWVFAPCSVYRETPLRGGITIGVRR